jgi:hypothetical protein
MYPRWDQWWGDGAAIFAARIEATHLFTYFNPEAEAAQKS